MAVPAIAVVKEVVVESAKQAIKESVKEGTKEALKKTAELAKEKSKELAKKEIQKEYAFISENYKKTKTLERIKAAKSNPELRRALLNQITKDGLGGKINEMKNFADLSKSGATIKELVSGSNRIDIFTKKLENPRIYSRLMNDSKNGFYLKDMLIKKGESIAMECKDGSLNYMLGDKAHIVGQLNAGKELSSNSLLQITPDSYLEFKNTRLPLKAKEFFDYIKQANGKIIVDGLSRSGQIEYVRGLMENIT